MLHDANAVVAKQPVSLVILHGPGRWVERLAIHFEDAPLAVLAHEEVSLSSLTPGSRREP